MRRQPSCKPLGHGRTHYVRVPAGIHARSKCSRPVLKHPVLVCIPSRNRLSAAGETGHRSRSRAGPSRHWPPQSEPQLADPRSDRHDSRHHHQTAFLVADHPPDSGRRDPVGRAKLIPTPNPLRTRLIRLPDSTSRTWCAPMGTSQAERLPASRNQL